MDIVFWVAVVVVALLMLLIGGRALKFNQRIRTRDDGEWP